MSWIVFDEESAAATREFAGIEDLEVGVRGENQSPLEWALERGKDSVVLLPGSQPGTVLLARVAMPRATARPVIAEPKPAASWMATGILGLEGEAEYLDEVKPRRAWWKAIFGGKQ